MKVTVTEVFQDKNTKNHHYVGEVLEIKDEARVDELVSAKVVKAVESSKPAKKTTKE